jgi:hypothetical protein
LSNSEKLAERSSPEISASETEAKMGNNAELAIASEVGATLQDVEGLNAV